MANICVTGGAGYIGSHCVKYLLEHSDHSVIVIDNVSTGHEWALSNCEKILKRTIPFYRCNVGDTDSVSAVFKKHAVDTLIHFAAYSLVEESQRDPLKYFSNNTANTFRLLETAVTCGVKNIIFSSTASVYGEAEYVPIDEKHRVKPVNNYGLSKLLIENVLQASAVAYGMNYAILRYFNVAGADSAGIIGECHNPETHLIPLVLKTALGSRDKAMIFGTDYPTKDGTAVRDYIHVTDLVKAHYDAYTFLSKTNKSGIFNLGSAQGYSVREVIDTVKDVVKKDFVVEEAGRRAGDPPVLLASAKAASDILGWSPNLSLRVMVESAYEWEKKICRNQHII